VSHLVTTMISRREHPCDGFGPCLRVTNRVLKVWDAESGVLHRELEGFGVRVTALATFLSPDGQQVRLVAGAPNGRMWVYDPEAGSALHHLDGHTKKIVDVACIASSSAAPHHPRLVSASWDRTAKVWDGETGECLANLRGHQEVLMSVVVWKEHHGGHDRIATSGGNGRIKIWDGEALTLLHDLDCESHWRMLPFESAEGPARLLVAPDRGGLQVWDPEEGRVLHGGINRGCPLDDCHLFESAQGHQFLAITGSGDYHAQHPGDMQRVFLDVWDLGEALARTQPLRPANKHG
jgi:WD40 repeat protein